MQNDQEEDNEYSDIQEFTDERLEASNVLPKAVLKVADDMTREDARFLIDTYYMYQRERIGKDSQTREAKRNKEPTAILEHFRDAAALHEAQAGRLLTRFSKSTQTGRWATSQLGVGGVITAGLISIIDMDEAVSPSHMMSHAGLNPSQKWEKGQPRPFNVRLKTLAAFKLGECLVKVQGKEDAFYGNLFAHLKREEMERNDSGRYKQPALDSALNQFKGADGRLRNGLYSADTDAWQWVNACFPAGACREIAEIPLLPLPDEIMELEGKAFTAAKNKWRVEMRVSTLARLKGEPGSGQPMLPPAQIHARARRRTVKIFLQHFWEELFVERYNSLPPEPYVFEHMGHFHKIERPNPSLPDPGKPVVAHPRIPRSRMPGYKPKAKKKKAVRDDRA